MPAGDVGGDVDDNRQGQAVGKGKRDDGISCGCGQRHCGGAVACKESVGSQCQLAGIHLIMVLVHLIWYWHAAHSCTKT